MFAVTRSPLASPAALQHMLGSTFPFPHAFGEAAAISAAARSSRPGSPLASPGGTHLPHHLHAQFEQHQQNHNRGSPRMFSLQSPLGRRFDNSLIAKAANETGHGTDIVTHLNSILLRSDPPKATTTIGGGILLRPGALRSPSKTARRPSFIDIPRPRRDGGSILHGDASLEEKMAELGVKGEGSGTAKSLALRERVPTPYPKEGGIFWAEDVPEEGPADPAESVAEDAC